MLTSRSTGSSGDQVDDAIGHHNHLAYRESVETATDLVVTHDDLLDLGAMASGTIRLDAEETDLGEIIEAAFETIQESADAKGVSLTKVLPPGACLVFGDPRRLQQVIWNLLNNAVKFTPRGGSVTTTLKRVNGDWEVCVSDTGVGLSAERLAFIYARGGIRGLRLELQNLRKIHLI